MSANCFGRQESTIRSTAKGRAVLRSAFAGLVAVGQRLAVGCPLSASCFGMPSGVIRSGKNATNCCSDGLTDNACGNRAAAKRLGFVNTLQRRLRVHRFVMPLIEWDMEIKFNPSKDEQGSGITSFASWNNPDLQRALEIAFNINRQRERIDTVEVTSEGITVRLSYRHEAVTA